MDFLGTLYQTTLGPIIREVAPAIAKSFGGPLGGVAAEILMDALQVPKNATQQEVKTAAEAAAANTDEARARIAEAEERFKSKAAETMAQLGITVTTQVNETIRAEIAAGVSWWHWRHLLGYLVLVLGIEVCVLLPLVVLGKITAVDMTDLIAAVTPVLTVFSALLGVVAYDTTNLKTAALTGEQPRSLITRTMNAIKGK